MLSGLKTIPKYFHALNMCMCRSFVASTRKVDNIGGNFHNLEYGDKDATKRCVAEHNDIGMYTLNQNGLDHVAVFSPDALKEAYKIDSTGGTKNMWPESWQMLLGSNAVTLLYGTNHKRLRKVLNPIFQEQTIRYRFDTLYAATQQFIDPLIQLTKQKNEYIPIRAYSKRWAYDIASVFIFGSGEDGVMTKNEHEQLWLNCCELLSGFTDMDPNNATIHGTPLYNAMEARERIMRQLWGFVLRAKDMIKENKLHEKNVMYQLLSIDEDNISKQELLDNIFFIFLAAHDTTSASLHNIFYILHTYAENIQILRKEFETINKITFDTIKEQKYLDCFVKESIRYLPVVYGIPKQLMRDEVICGYDIPKGYTLLLDILGQSRNEKVFEDPEVFNPMRFMGNTKQTVDDYNFSAFGLGTKRCLGWQLAYIELKLITMMLVTQTDIEVDADRLRKADYSHLHFYDVWAKLSDCK